MSKNRHWWVTVCAFGVTKTDVFHVEDGVDRGSVFSLSRPRGCSQALPGTMTSVEPHE